MQHWGDNRRYTAALREQDHINEEMAERARSESKKGGNLGFLLFIVVVVLFEPFGEYCIALYGSATSYLHGITGMLGL